VTAFSRLSAQRVLDVQVTLVHPEQVERAEVDASEACVDLFKRDELHG